MTIPKKLNELTLCSVVKSLAKKRPVFHSEADFQFALAWELKRKFRKADIRIERPFGGELNEYLDIQVCIGDDIYPIELKYKTKELKIEISNEKFHLKDQGAQNHGSYDFLWDIKRIEKLSRDKKFKTGFVIWLTNDMGYLTPPKNKKVGYAKFSVYDGREIKARQPMKWQGQTATRGRDTPISLKNDYTIGWKDYGQSNQFKYALITIEKPKSRH